MHSPPSSDCRSGSSLAAHRRASTGREVFIAPLAAHGKLQVPSCHPYEVRARGSERSRRVRFGTGPGSLEKVAVFGSRFLKTLASLPGRQSRCNAAALPAGKACPGLQKTGSKDGNLLKGPWAGPKPHAAASLRPPGSHLIRLAGRHLELLSGRPGRDEDPAASG